jgi:hypothetical protein
MDHKGTTERVIDIVTEVNLTKNFCFLEQKCIFEHCVKVKPGNTIGGSISVPLTSCLTGLDYSVLQIKTKIVSCHTADSKPVKQEVNGTVILPPLVFPG